MCGFYDMIRERRYAARAAWNVGRSPLKTAIALLSGDRKNPAACQVQLYFDCYVKATIHAALTSIFFVGF